VVSVVQPLSLADELRIEPAPPGVVGDEVVCPGIEGRNLAADALAAYRAVTGWAGPALRLTIAKEVPVAAGMGGGSSDAAAALRLVAAAAGRSDDGILEAIAPRLGSDVPALLAGGRTLGTGAGEVVAPLPDDPEPFGLLVLPSEVRLSTPAVYREFDRLGLGRSPAELEAVAQAIAGAGSAPVPVNDLEPAARSLEPSIDAALADARSAGADHAMVSGSGPTVFGLFRGTGGLARARAAASALARAGRHPRALAAEPVGPDFGRPRGVRGH
jgi:4-diphosphocytidyl-2-C-methyl-D-erythritol kinase